MDLRRTFVRGLAAAACFVWVGAGAGWAALPSALLVTLGGIAPGGVIPDIYAYCVPSPDPKERVMPGPDQNPEVRWSAGPPGTASYAIITSDPDAPSVFTAANNEGAPIPPSVARITAYHWVLVDVPATLTRIAAGADSNGRVAAGKPPGQTAYGVRGVNGMGPGPHGGYDGPCPPWSDDRVHHYHFTVYALDVARLNVTGNFTALDALAAMQGHILAEGEAVGLYSTNPAVRNSIGAH